MINPRVFVCAIALVTIVVVLATAQSPHPITRLPEIVPPPGADQPWASDDDPPVDGPAHLAEPPLKPCPGCGGECHDLLLPFQQRASGYSEDADTHVPPRKFPVPSDFMPWWQEGVTNPLRHAHSQPIDVNRLILAALQHSQHVKAISERPLIRQTAVLEADGEFDVWAFMESKFIRTSEPVGDLLTTGGPPRFRESDWGYSAGLRKKTRLGGRFELSQRVGYRDNNSLFFVPTQQGNARLTLSFEQPLLSGAGRAYNNSLIVLADIETRIAWDQTAEELQQYLVDVNKAYWELYLQRASLLQMDRWYDRAVAILKELDERREIDSLKSQIVRARAAVAVRRAELVRSAAAIRNAEARLRALVNAPELIGARLNAAEHPNRRTVNVELVPVQPPGADFVPVEMRTAMQTALKNRPEIDRSLRELDAASIRLKMSKNELLPALSLLIETYVAGLEGRSEIGTAWVNQFNQGEPGYTAGLLFEMPLHNRTARARYQRRQLELRQLMHQFNAAVELLMAEVEVAVRDVNTSYREMQAKYSAMIAAETDVDYMTQRWRLLPGDDRAASFALEDLLDAQDRLADEEFDFAQAHVAYVVALAELKRATGTLLKHERISPYVMYECGTPRVYRDQPN